MKKRLKQIMPRRQTLIKVIAILLIMSFFTTYISSALNKQATTLPENPLEQTAENNSSMSLIDDYKDLVHAEELSNDASDEDELAEDQENESDEEDKKDDQNKEKNTEKDNKSNPTNSEEDSKKQSDEDKKQEAELNDEGEKDKKNKEGDRQGNGLDKNKGKDEESSNKEITNPDEDHDQGINKYFTTSIEDGESVTKEKYNFRIEQLNHDYAVKDIKVSVDAKEGKVGDISDDFTLPVYVNLSLAAGENEIKVGVTYENDKEERFTVFNSYIVILGEEELIIKSDLKDKEVSQQTLTFHASAELGDERAPVTVKLNEDNLTESANGEYEVQLNEGQNEIRIESQHKELEAHKTYTIHYVKPDLTIETNLTEYHDQTVDQDDFTFHAEAFYGDENTDLEVYHNDDSITGDEEGNYSITLDEEENTFQLIAKKDDIEQSKTYQVYYVPEAKGGKDEDEENNEPEITILDIADGDEMKNETRTFHVKAQNYTGESITGGNGTVKATNNGNAINIDWSDHSQVSFTLNLENGENHIVVTATDQEGNTATKELTVIGDIAEEGGVIGTTTISLEATTIGLGHLISAQQVEIHQGDRAVDVIDRLFKEYGFTYDHTGSSENAFYLSAIYKPGVVTDPTIPDDLAELLERDMGRFDPEDYQSDSLGEFDFTDGSGWMYSVNGNYPNVGFSDYYFKDGDVVRIRFTLSLGADIGGGPPGQGYNKEW